MQPFFLSRTPSATPAAVAVADPMRRRCCSMWQPTSRPSTGCRRRTVDARTASGRCAAPPGSGRCSRSGGRARPRRRTRSVELLRDAVDARDRFPGLWAPATESGAVGGRDLRQLVRQHRDKPLTETLRIDADQVVVLRSEPDLWHAVFRASRFLGRVHRTRPSTSGQAEPTGRDLAPEAVPRCGRRGLGLAFRS